MADIIPLTGRLTRKSAGPVSAGWRLVTVRPEPPGFTVEIWTGKPTDDNTIRALAGIRSTWPEAMALAHDRARQLSIEEVVDWSGVAPDDPEQAA